MVGNGISEPSTVAIVSKAFAFAVSLLIHRCISCSLPHYELTLIEARVHLWIVSDPDLFLEAMLKPFPPTVEHRELP